MVQDVIRGQYLPSGRSGLTSVRGSGESASRVEQAQTLGVKPGSEPKESDTGGLAATHRLVRRRRVEVTTKQEQRGEITETRLIEIEALLACCKDYILNRDEEILVIVGKDLLAALKAARDEARRDVGEIRERWQRDVEAVANRYRQLEFMHKKTMELLAAPLAARPFVLEVITNPLVVAEMKEDAMRISRTDELWQKSTPSTTSCLQGILVEMAEFWCRAFDRQCFTKRLRRLFEDLHLV